MKKILYIRLIVFVIALIVALIILTQNRGEETGKSGISGQPPVVSQDLK